MGFLREKQKFLILLIASLFFFIFLIFTTFYWLLSYQVEVGKSIEIGSFHLAVNNKIEEDDWEDPPRILREEEIAGDNYFYLANAVVESYDSNSRILSFDIGKESLIKGVVQFTSVFSTFIARKDLLNNRMLIILKKENKVPNLKPGEVILIAFSSTKEIKENTKSQIRIFSIVKRLLLL